MRYCDLLEAVHPFGPIYHTTSGDIDDFSQFDLSRASQSAVLGPAIYATFGDSKWSPNHLQKGKTLKGYVRGKIIDLTRPLEPHDIELLSAFIGREIDVPPLLTLERRYGSVAAGLQKAGYAAAIHRGPGATGNHIAIFDPSSIMQDRELTEAKLPRSVAGLLDKPISIVLKDGRPGELLITHGQETRVLHGGLLVTATVDNQYAGSMSIYPNTVPRRRGDIDLYADDRGSWSVNSLHVNDEFRRQGIATAMYNTLAKTGMKILSSGHYGGKLLPDGAELWQSNRPKVRLGQKPKPHRFWTVSHGRSK